MSVAPASKPAVGGVCAEPRPGPSADAGDTADLLTFISVHYRNAEFLAENLRLTRALNSGQSNRWIVVDNEASSARTMPTFAGADLMPGAARPRSPGRGSLHHALGLTIAMAAVDTRFVLIIDPDFYVIRRNWIAEVLAYVRLRKLAFFGAVWNPRWFYQYRGFPTVHFMLIDLERVARDAIDLTPSISSDRWWQWINDDRTPLPRFLRDTLKATRCRDTGWRLRQQYHQDPDFPAETLLPHYRPPENRRYRLERKLARVLPASWRKFPADASHYTLDSVLERIRPDVYSRGWEEFFWHGSPFAVHLRRMGRGIGGDPTADDGALVAPVLDALVKAAERH